jgi:hypothetical protein
VSNVRAAEPASGFSTAVDTDRGWPDEQHDHTSCAHGYRSRSGRDRHGAGEEGCERSACRASELGSIRKRWPKTPHRMAHAYAEMLDALPSNLATFENAEQYDEPVLVEGIPLRWLCEHPHAAVHRHRQVGYLRRDHLTCVSHRPGCMEGAGALCRTSAIRGHEASPTVGLLDQPGKRHTQGCVISISSAHCLEPHPQRSPDRKLCTSRPLVPQYPAGSHGHRPTAERSRIVAVERRSRDRRECQTKQTGVQA